MSLELLIWLGKYARASSHIKCTFSCQRIKISKVKNKSRARQHCVGTGRHSLFPRELLSGGMGDEDSILTFLI